jgi:hypothetical protein
MTCTHGCNGTRRLGSHMDVPCPCARENSDDALDRVTAEKQELVRTVDELSLLVVDLERERNLLRAEVQRLLSQRLKLLDALGERAAALQAALNLDGARALMALVREVADG